MTIPKAGTRRGKRPRRRKAPQRKKVAKRTNSKKRKAPAASLVVFAFRLSREERDRIHAAAGSGKATQFVRSAALAAARGDAKAFQNIVAQYQVDSK